MLIIIDSFGIPNSVGEYYATEPVPQGMLHPVWASNKWISNEQRYLDRDAHKPVPQSVTMRQARLALHFAGLLSGVDAAIASMPEPDKTAAQITWEFAQTVDRGFGMVPALAASMGMTDAQIDDLFIAAAQL